MATPTLVATPGASNANSYCTVAEADAYHEERLFATDWSGASTADKTVALIWASRQLDQLYTWFHWPTNPRASQAMQWPRTGMLDVDQTSTLSDSVIPRELKWATAEFARQLLVSNRTADSDIEVQGITSLSAGPISLSFKDSVKLKIVPDAVSTFIPYWWGHLKGQLNTAPVSRG